MGLDMTNLSADLRRRIMRDNPDELKRLVASVPAMVDALPKTVEDTLNKTERAYLVYARALPDTKTWAQALGLRLSGIGGSRVFYYPDFCLLDANGIRFIDTKPLWSDGKPHVEDDARVKICWAAQVYAPIPFLIAWRAAGGWHHRRMFPGMKL